MSKLGRFSRTELLLGEVGMEKLANSTVAIFGVGGTGGVIGGYLANAGNDVTFLARGAHLAAMQKDGLTLHTKHRGDIRIKPCKAMLADDYHDTPDVLFICVKYYGLDAAIALTRRIAGPDTLVIPILNVFGTGAVMQEKLPGKATVVVDLHSDGDI